MQVFPELAPVVARRNGSGGHRDAVCVHQRQFLGQHGVQPVRHDGTGHDAHRLAALHGPAPECARVRRADYLQRQRRTGPQRSAIEGVTVHRRVVMRRHADGGDQIVGQYPAQGVEDIDGLFALHWLNQARQKIPYLGGAQTLRVVTLQLRDDLVNAQAHFDGACNSASVLMLKKPAASSKGTTTVLWRAVQASILRPPPAR